MPTVTVANNESEDSRMPDNADATLTTNAHNDYSSPNLTPAVSASAEQFNLADKIAYNTGTVGPSVLASLHEAPPASHGTSTSAIAADHDTANVSVTKPDNAIDSPQPEAHPHNSDHSEHDDAARVHVGGAPLDRALSPPRTCLQIQRSEGNRFNRVGSVTQNNETESQLSSVFMSMAALSSHQISTICKDAERTHILHYTFHGHEKEEAGHDLLLLLNAYALWDASVGYCQVLSSLLAFCQHNCVK